MSIICCVDNVLDGIGSNDRSSKLFVTLFNCLEKIINCVSFYYYTNYFKYTKVSRYGQLLYENKTIEDMDDGIIN